MWIGPPTKLIDLEKVVADRLIAHLQENNLYEPLQSAYRQYCSTETALLKVQDHILKNLDKRKGVVLLLLDLSAAFDTVDHATLLNTLENTFGVTGQCLSWVASYLSHRQQSVCISGERSSSRNLSCGVPQGSVLGPLLFTMYIAPLAAILRQYGIHFHIYADDTQIYLEFDMGDPTSMQTAIDRVERCVATVREWMRRNTLILNDDKSELLIIRPRSAGPQEMPETFTIGNATIVPSQSARILGVIFDSTMALENHVANTCRAAYYQLHGIGRIRRYLDQQTAKQLVHALVVSRLDSCNSLLVGLTVDLLGRLQRVQNACAKVIMRRRKYDHVTPLLKELHWLPMDMRIRYKVLMLTFKCLHGLAPQYLVDLITPYRPGRQLRSADQLLLVQPRARTRLGERAFSYAGPHLWNGLPLTLRQCRTLSTFKVSLKTHLFKDYFAC
jgi:hypothetical protein